MGTETELQKKIEALVIESDLPFKQRAEGRQQIMNQLEIKEEYFESLASEWLRELVGPRLAALAAPFSNARSMHFPEGSFRAGIMFDHCDEFPVHAQVEVSVTHDEDINHAWVKFTPSIFPILTNPQTQTRCVIDLRAPDIEVLGGVVDKAILLFAADYLKVRDPKSVYQKGHLVQDPVCGMVLRRADATVSIDHEGGKVFFCASSCKEHFEKAPGRYIGANVRSPVGSWDRAGNAQVNDEGKKEDVI